MGGGEVGTPRGLARSSSGVWWKLGDAAATSEVERRLRVIAEEAAAVRARVERRHAAAPAVRRRIAAASMGLEAVALVYGLWAAARSRRLTLVHLLPALAVPAMATLVLAAFARFRRTLDGRDQQHLERLRRERLAASGEATTTCKSSSRSMIPMIALPRTRSSRGRTRG